MPCIWNEWLPEPLASRVRTDEPQRFAALISALAQCWAEAKAARPPDDAATPTLPFVPLVKNMLNAKAEPGAASIQLLAETLLDIMLHCAADLPAQARWGAQLNRLLRSHRRRLRLTVPWRPLRAMLRRAALEPSAGFEGVGVAAARNKALLTLALRGRRFFPPGAAAEIWADLAPALRDVSSPDAFEALGWLAVLMPTQAAARRDGDWGAWAPEWLALWGAVTHVPYWQSLWMSLFARLIRHDVHGAVPWPALLPELATRLGWAFNLPVGAATAAPPFSGAAPGPGMALFGGIVGSRPAAAARALVDLIGRHPPGVGGGQQAYADKGGENGMGEGEERGEGDSALEVLETVVGLLEQYYHPSNGGKWTAGLATFLKEASARLCQRLVAERGGGGGAAPGGGEDWEGDSEAEEEEGDEDDDSDGDSEEGEDSGDEGCCGDSDAGDDDAVAAAAAAAGEDPKGGAAPSPWARRPLSRGAARRVVAALVRLAAKGQASKDGHMRRYASVALAQLAHVAPDLVLPFVAGHFQTALDTVTAARQYGNAIQTLSLCVRPLLLAGLAGADGAEPRAAAAAAVAAAVMATLPGIDANDPPKSLAVFRLYCCVLSVAGELPEAPGAPGAPAGALPLYTEVWVDELLSRIFTVITNLDAPDAGAEHGGRDDADADGATFLLEGSSMFRPMMELLYMRLPPALRVAAIRRTAAFLLGNAFSSVSSEAAILCNAMAWADARTTAEALLIPLLGALERDAAALDSSGGGGGARLSRVAENSLRWRLTLLSSASYRLGPALVPHGARVRGILGAFAVAASQAVQEAAARALASVVQGLCTYYPLEQCAPCRARLQPPGDGATAVEAYIDFTGAPLGGTQAAPVMTWHLPSPAELELADQLLQEFAEGPARRLAATAAAGGAIPKETLRAELLQLEGALGGARSCLPDFPGCEAPPDAAAAPIGIIGALGPPVGSPELRVLVADALAAVTALVPPSDAESAAMCLRVIGLTLARGDAEHADSSSAAASWGSDERWMHEPPVSGLLLDTLGDVALVGAGGGRGSGSSGGGGYGSRWRRRRPMWVAQEKVYLNMEWRAAQAAYRWWPTAAAPAVASSAALPGPYLNLLAAAVRLVLQGASGVRELAGALVERAMKRFPVLTPSVMAPLLCGIAKVPEGLAFDPAVTVGARMGLLREAAAGAAARAAAAAAAGEAAEPEAEQAMACGGAAVLRGIAIWRHVTRDWTALRALLLSFIAGAAHTGTQAQGHLSLGSVVTILKFMRPPGALGGAAGPAAAAAAGEVCADALAAAAPGAGPALPWRYAAAANLQPLLVLPALEAPAAGALAVHYLALLDSDAPAMRGLGAGALAVLLLPLWSAAAAGAAVEAPWTAMAPAAVEAARGALAGALAAPGAAPALAPRLLANLANGHTALAGGSDAARSMLSQLSKDDALPKTVLGALLRGEWPAGRAVIPAVSAGHFVPLNARMVHLLATVAPEAIVPALQGPVEAALAGAQDGDRQTTAAAAEALAGLAACPAVFEGAGGGAWAAWIRPLLARAAAAAPLELVDIWSAALRFPLHEHTAAGRHDAVEALLGVVTQMNGGEDGAAGGGGGGGGGGGSEAAPAAGTAPGMASGAVYKRIMYAREALEELGVAFGTAAAPPPLRALLARELDELPALARGHGEMVRQAAAGLAAEACLTLLLAPEGAGADADADADLARLRARAAAFLDRLCADFAAATAVLYDQARASGVAGGASAPAADGAAKVPSVEAGDTEVLEAAQAAIAAVMERRRSLGMDGAEGSAAAMEAEGEGEEEEGGSGSEEEDMDPAEMAAAVAALRAALGGASAAAAAEAMDVEESLAASSHDAAYQAAVSTVAFSVEWLVQMLASNAAAAAPWVLAALPPLLRLQDLVPSELQFVALVARKALIAAKYQPFRGEEVRGVLGALRAAAAAPLWPERAAALLFAQYFWFRHVLLLGREGTGEVVATVLARLEDDKLEVRELAAATASGLLRGLPEGDAAALRARFLARAAEAFPARGRRRRRGEADAAPRPPPPPAPVRHGAALGLQALVLSSPYDVPPWLPDVLMALVRLAGEPAPVRGTVTKALAEFRRTHEEGGLVEAKAALTAEQWEAIRDVASPASYFV